MAYLPTFLRLCMVNICKYTLHASYGLWLDKLSRTNSSNGHFEWVSQQKPKQKFWWSLPSLPELTPGYSNSSFLKHQRSPGTWEQFKGTSMPFEMTITMPNKRNWRASLSGTPWHSSSWARKLQRKQLKYPTLGKRKIIDSNMSWMGIYIYIFIYIYVC